MRASMTRRLAVLLGTTVLALAVAPLTAWADDAPPAGVEESAEAVAEVPGLAATVSEDATVNPDADTAVSVTDAVTGTTIDIPTDPSDGISLGTAQGEVTIGVPGARRAEHAETVGATAVYEKAAPATDIAVQPIEDGVRVLAVLDGEEAPSRLAFPIELPEGAYLTGAEGGGAEVIAVDGSLIAAVDPAWAVDANNNVVATHYEINGNTITQVIAVEEGAAYPIVADPAVRTSCGWLSCSTYFSITRTREIQRTLNGSPGYFAAAAHATALCSAIGVATAGVGAIPCSAVYALGYWRIKASVDDAVRLNGCLRISYGLSRNSIGTVYGSPNCFLN